jgi:hypothetical protein
LFFVVEDIRRRSVRVLKLHRGFIPTKKEISPHKIPKPPWPPSGAFLGFLKISKVVLWFRNSDMTSEGLGEMLEGDYADM